MKVSELSGTMLDYWAAKAEELNVHLRPVGQPPLAACVESWQRAIIVYRPSANWAQGGPIIEREGIWLSDDGEEDVGPWIASCKPHANKAIYEGSTPLEAAMRCFVASRFGDEVNDELAHP